MTDAATNTPRWFDWLFRDRTSGHVVVAQWPNAPLWVFIAASLVRRFAGLSGAPGAAVTGAAAVALGVWAVMEIGWGVNPWRRALGALVLATSLGRLVS